MRRLAEQFVDAMQEFGRVLDFSEASVGTIELMSRGAVLRLAAVAARKGCEEERAGRFVSRRVCRRGHGSQPRRRMGLDARLRCRAVRLPSGTWTSPPAKAKKGFIQGQEDNLVAYYEAMKTV
jgi:hypothetical protein